MVHSIIPSRVNLDAEREELHLRSFQHEPEVVGPEALSHPEVRRGVIRGNLFKYFNIFIDAL